MVKDIPKYSVLEPIRTNVGFLSTLIANIYQKLDESYKTLLNKDVNKVILKTGDPLLKIRSYFQTLVYRI